MTNAARKNFKRLIETNTTPFLRKVVRDKTVVVGVRRLVYAELMKRKAA